MSTYFYSDEIDISDLKRDAAAQRKCARAYCPECKCTGEHASGCPEDTGEEGEEETN